ncbi:MAG: PD40 domain-containing protein [bacterium]|nr:PD40 domain-containing protein [bacterium]
MAAEKIVFSSNESGNHDIWMINPDGTGKMQITNSAIDEFSPKISHDGKTIAFTRFDGGQYHGNIYFYDVATGAVSQVTSANDVAYDLSWSPDDTKIAYSRSCGGRQIAVLDLATSAVDVLTGCSGGSYGAIWHPTDGRIYYWDYIPGGCNWGMYSVPATGGTAERADGRTYWDTEWSFNPTNPDNIAAAVYFGTGCLHGSYLALLNRADTNYTLLHGGGDIADRNPAWSPDGTRIAFATQEWTVTTARNVCVYDVQSGNLDTLPIGASGGSQYGSIADLSWGTIVSTNGPIYWAGTGHWYEVVKGPSAGLPWISWTACRDSARARGGYLASISESGENQFITSIIPTEYTSKAIGGCEVSEGNWAWDSGEPFVYTNWAPGEPSNSWGGTEAYMYYGVNFPGQWHDGTLFGADAFVVEYEVEPNFIEFPGLSALPCDTEILVQPVRVRNWRPVVGMNIPLSIPEGAEVISVQLGGLATEGWDELIETQIDNQSGTLRMVLTNSPLEELAPGNHLIANIHFKAAAQCTTSTGLHWDTTLSSDPERMLSFSDSRFNSFEPHFDNMKDSFIVHGYLRGDNNGDRNVDLSDLSALIAYLTQTPRPAPCVLQAANANGDPKVDLSDLTILIAYLTSTPRPILQCGAAASPFLKPDIGYHLATVSNSSRYAISLSSQLPLRAVLLKVQTSGSVGSLLSSEFDLFVERAGNEVIILAVDLQGRGIIDPGTQELFAFSEEVTIISSEASTAEFATVYGSISNLASLVPVEFGLSQNYPNPFNPSTEISYSLPTAAYVTLEVYNLTGQRVAILVNSDQASGTHTVRWDASQYASGVYMYRLTTGEFTETKKMLLIK